MSLSKQSSPQSQSGVGGRVLEEETKEASGRAMEYAKLEKYHTGEDFTFSIHEQPLVSSFEEVIGEKMKKVAICVLNTVENFPLTLNKDGMPCRKQREYFPENTDGKKVDYIAVDDTFKDDTHEYLYCLAYDGRIVKIGMTITSLKKRWCGSYSCGTTRAMAKGSCSTTNYIITECNFSAVKAGMDVEVYGICCPKKVIEVTRFGITRAIFASTVRGLETMLTQSFRETYGNKPVLCVQEGN
tara:strand:+ start:14287 stop:15012 length:726 start_codon:yes stop_codon:yes gene_type:complete